MPWEEEEAEEAEETRGILIEPVLLWLEICVALSLSSIFSFPLILLVSCLQNIIAN